MKKKLIILGAATILMAAVGINAYAHNQENHRVYNQTYEPVHVQHEVAEDCSGYMDADQDGICDNGSNHDHGCQEECRRYTEDTAPRHEQGHAGRHNGGRQGNSYGSGHGRGHGRGHH